MKIRQKIGSLYRRRVSFFCVEYDWHKKDLQAISSLEEYAERLAYLRDIGMCKRCQIELEDEAEIGGRKFRVFLVSFGDIRANKMVYGENPIAIEFGVCLFDYVFAFFEEIPAKFQGVSEKAIKSDKISV